jgi:MFS family permease
VIGMLQFRHFAVLVVITFLIAIVHSYFFFWNSPFLTAVLRRGGVLSAWEQRISSLGQISEVLVMALLGLAISRFGFKTTLLVGTLAYFTRCVVLAAAIVAPGPFAVSITLACLGQALHGLCFGCFLATAFIFVDRVAPADVRGSMQTLFGTFVFGAGALIGAIVPSVVAEAFISTGEQPGLRAALGIANTSGILPFKDGQMIDWPGVWLSCGLLALLCVVAFAVLFPRRPESGDAGGAHGTGPGTMR